MFSSTPIQLWCAYSFQADRIIMFASAALGFSLTNFRPSVTWSCNSAIVGSFTYLSSRGSTNYSQESNLTQNLLWTPIFGTPWHRILWPWAGIMSSRDLQHNRQHHNITLLLQRPAQTDRRNQLLASWSPLVPLSDLGFRKLCDIVRSIEAWITSKIPRLSINHSRYFLGFKMLNALQKIIKP